MVKEAGDQASLTHPDDPEADSAEVMVQATHEGHFTSLPGALALEHVLCIHTFSAFTMTTSESPRLTTK